jgi:2',3'-cyclic-nucleotide 2'-phosphodiesterase (5'-nucleotidase family)
MGCRRVTVIGRRRGVLPLVLTLVAFGVARPGGQQPAAPAPSATVTLSIVGTNDLHGAMAPRDGRGGLATFSGFVNNLRAARARDGGAVLVIDAGDMFQGTLESNLNEGAAIVDAYNAIGYTAITIGNHEFDFGPVGPRATPKMETDDPRGALKARAAQARFPFLAANLVEIKTVEPVRWPNMQPAVLVHAAGVNVGIIGVTTSRTLKATISGNTIGLAIAPLDTTIADQAARLRARGATVIIVTAHAGGRCTRFDNPADLTSCEQPSEIGEVVTKLPRGTIDAVVAGHTHQGMAHEVLGVPIIESFSSGRAFGRIDLTIARDRPHVASHRIFPPRDVCAYEDAGARCVDPARTPGAVHVQYEGKDVAPDPAVERVLAAAIDNARHAKQQPLGVSATAPIAREYGEESALGNLFADMMLAATSGADVALTNGGGLRANLPKGPLTFGDLYEAMPFDNYMVRLRLTGQELARVLAGNLGAGGGILSVAGVTASATCDNGTLRTILRRPSGAPVGGDEELTVATSDFLATGGDGAFAPVRLLRVTDAGDDGPLVRDAIADRLRERGGWLDAKQFFDPARPRLTYAGRRPVRCGTD